MPHQSVTSPPVSICPPIVSTPFPAPPASPPTTDLPLPTASSTPTDPPMTDLDPATSTSIDMIDYATIVPDDWTRIPRVNSREELEALDKLMRDRIYKYWRHRYVLCSQRIAELRDKPSNEHTDGILASYRAEHARSKSICHLLFVIDQQKHSSSTPLD